MTENRRRIDVSQPQQLRFWCAKLRVAPEQLKDAVAKVGDQPDAVRTYLEGGRFGPLAAGGHRPTIGR